MVETITFVGIYRGNHIIPGFLGRPFGVPCFGLLPGFDSGSVPASHRNLAGFPIVSMNPGAHVSTPGPSISKLTQSCKATLLPRDEMRSQSRIFLFVAPKPFGFNAWAKCFGQRIPPKNKSFPERCSLTTNQKEVPCLNEKDEPPTPPPRNGFHNHLKNG